MKALSLFVLVAIAFSQWASAQECTSGWQANLNTDPNQPKGYSGDTSAGYATLAFHGDPNIRFVLKGKFPKARFISLETYGGKLNRHFDAIVDTAIIPDRGSQNPFLEGADIDSPERNFTLNLVPEGYQSTEPNVIHMPNKGAAAFMFRIYAPDQNQLLGVSDLPQIFAYDATTGAPMSCPEPRKFKEYLKLPQVLATTIIGKKTVLNFRPAAVNLGGNGAIPTYLYDANQTNFGDVTVVHFKAPQFMDTTSGVGPFPRQEETRYWSLCLQNFVKNETRACLPDVLAKVDAKGFVNLVYGGSDHVKQLAEAAGFNYLPESRAKNQKVLGFAYRNLVPSEAFKNGAMYQGDYLPTGVVCQESEFVQKLCGWER